MDIYSIAQTASHKCSRFFGDFLLQAVLRLLSRQYVLAARIITGCHKDSALTKEELWILSHLPVDDCHPDALACRLRLTLLCRDCGTVPEWKPDDDFKCYLSTHSHVRVACRLSENEERRLLSYYPIGSRTQYLNAMTNAPAQIAVKGTCQSGGLVLDHVHADLMSKALQTSCKSPSVGLGHIHLYYNRPEEQVVTGASALRLIDTVWVGGGLLGSWGCRTGFPLLYDILLGRRKIEFVTNEAQHERALEGSTPKGTPYTMKSQSPAVDTEQAPLRKERHKRIREFLASHKIKIPSAVKSTANAYQSRQTESLPWEKSTLSVPPSLEEAFAAVDGGDRHVTKKSASFVKLMTSAIILKNTREPSQINLTNPSGVAACMLLSLAHAVLHDMPVAALMRKAKGMANKMLQQGKRERRTWEFSYSGEEWSRFGEESYNALERAYNQGINYCYLQIEGQKLPKPVSRTSAVHKSDRRWYYVRYSEKSKKYVATNNREGTEQEFAPSELLLSAQVSMPKDNQTTGRLYIGSSKNAKVRIGSVVTTCGEEDLVLENTLDTCNEEHQCASEHRAESASIAATPAVTDPVHPHATIITLKRIAKNLATWKKTPEAKSLSSFLAKKTDFEFTLYIASAASHLPKCTEAGALSHASASACAAAVSEWTESLRSLQQPREGESAIEAKTRFEAEMKIYLAQAPTIKIVPMRVTVVVREADADLHETHLLVSCSDSFVSVKRRLLRALLKKHRELTEHIQASQCTFSAILPQVSLIDIDGTDEAKIYQADDDATLLSNLTDENEPRHIAEPALSLVLTLSAPKKAKVEIVDFSCLPSFPFLRHESGLLARGTSGGSDDLKAFFGSLAATSLAICSQENANKKPFKRLECNVAQVNIFENSALNSSPVPFDCANASKRLTSMAPVERGHGMWPGISPDDVRAFAASPLENFGLLRRDDASNADVVPTKVVSLQPAVADVDNLMTTMPLDLTRCLDAQSAVAQDLLKRINRDLKLSAAALEKKKVPRLTCLDGFFLILTHACLHLSMCTQI